MIILIITAFFFCKFKRCLDFNYIKCATTQETLYHLNLNYWTLVSELAPPNKYQTHTSNIFIFSDKNNHDYKGEENSIFQTNSWLYEWDSNYTFEDENYHFFNLHNENKTFHICKSKLKGVIIVWAINVLFVGDVIVMFHLQSWIFYPSNTHCILF